MAAIDTTTRSRLAFPATVLARLVNGAALLLRRLENRRQILRLAEMTDRELSDIGIRRGDLHEAWRLSIETDPTLHLERLARSRASMPPGRRTA